MTTPVRAPKATIERQNADALREAREADRIEPRAVAISYDPTQGHFLVTLRGGWIFGFPPEQIPGLERATAAQIANVRLSPSGDGMHWDDLDIDVSLTGLMVRALHLQEWAPRLMGQIRSEVKARAARKNGLKGGRPGNQATRKIRRQTPGAGSDRDAATSGESESEF